MTKIIGLTGGIGSGKSTIANYFQSLGIPLYFADDASRELTESDEILKQIQDHFGKSVFENDKLNRQKLAQLVFNDPQKLKVLNAIIHPAVKRHFDAWLSEHAKYPLIIKEAAILFESGSYKDCDQIITVTAPIETRIDRVVARDKISREQVLDRMKNQWTDEQRIAKSDYIIENVNLEESRLHAKEILKKLTIQ